MSSLPDHGVYMCDSSALVCSTPQAIRGTQALPSQALPCAQHLQGLAARIGAGLRPPQGHPLARGCNRSPLPLLAVPPCNSCSHCLDGMLPCAVIAATVQATLLSVTKTRHEAQHDL